MRVSLRKSHFFSVKINCLTVENAFLDTSIKMLADRNKSDLTHTVTEATFAWLDNHGFKPVETEVSMPWTKVDEPGWVADLAAVIVPTQTELVEMKLIPAPPRYNYVGKNDGYKEKREAWEAVYKVMDRRMTCLVEVKTTRAYYLGVRKWTMTPATDLAFVAVPSGMVKPEEWPVGWGVLELRGDLICKVRNPAPRLASLQEHLSVIYQIALRRDHRTRHEQTRDWWKAERAEDAVKTSMDRIDKIIDAVRDIAAGKTCWGAPITSVEDALKAHGIRNAKAAQLERLAELFGIAAKTKKETPCI